MGLGVNGSSVRWGRILFILCLFLAASCGHSAKKGSTTPPPPPPPVDANLVSLVPASTDLVARVDLVGLRQSALYQALGSFISDEDPFGAGINPVTQGNELLIAYSGKRDARPEQMLIALKGGFSAAQVLAKISAKEKVKTTRVGDFNLVKTPEFWVVALTARTLVVGSELILREVFEIAKNESAPATDSESTFSKLELTAGTTGIFQYKQGGSIPQPPSYGAFKSPIDLDEIVAAQGEFRLHEGFELKASITAPTELAAAQMQRKLTAMQRRYTKNMFVVLLGLDWIFKRLTLVTTKTELHLSVTLSGPDIVELKKIADKLLQMRELLSGEETSAPPKKLAPQGGAL